MKKATIEFILSSISDIQNTIRAIDGKLIAVLVLILLPVSKLENIVSVFINCIKTNATIGYFLLIVFTISWLMSLVYTLLGILSLVNPRQHVKDSFDIKGIYFGSGIYKFTLFESLMPGKVKSKESLKKYIQKFDLTEDNIFQELIFEQMKLIFIRDLKIQRQKIAIVSILISTLVGLFSWTLVLIKIFK